MDVADVEASSTIHASPAAHQLLQQNIIPQGDIEYSMNGENLEVGLELSLSSGEAV